MTTLSPIPAQRPQPLPQRPSQALAAPQQYNAPLPVQPQPMGGVSPVSGLVYQLGNQTRLTPQGMVQLNLPLVETIVKYREQAIPALYQLMSGTQNLLAMVEALYTAQRLAEERVPGTNQLYGATQYWHNAPHPLAQIYLAGFYRKLNAPETFGPLMTMLMRNALLPGPPIPGAFNPQEEIGGALLELMGNKAAEKLRPAH